MKDKINVYNLPEKNLLEFGYGIIKPHRVGFILAAHLYQSNLGNAEKQVETFNNLLKALSIVTEFGELSEEDLENHIDPNTTIGEEEISLIQKAGLPIAKDGKLKISSEAVKAILGAFDKEMLKDRAILKDKTREETKQQKGNITIKESTKAALLSGVTEEDIKKAKEQQSLEQQSLLNKTPDERVGEEEIENE